MHIYESAMKSYLQILEQNPGKALLLFGKLEHRENREVLLLVNGKVSWSMIKADGSMHAGDVAEVTNDVWYDGGWFGEARATRAAIEDPVLIDIPPMDSTKAASELRVGDLVVRPFGILRRIERIIPYPDRICVLFTCNSDTVFSPTDRVNVKAQAALKRPVSAPAPAAAPASEANVIEVRTSSSCSCDDDCECPGYDSLTFTINGTSGHGGGELVASGPQGDEFYACTFLGWTFKATSACDAKKQIQAYLRAFNGIQVQTF